MRVEIKKWSDIKALEIFYLLFWNLSKSLALIEKIISKVKERKRAWTQRLNLMYKGSHSSYSTHHMVSAFTNDQR